MSQPVTWRTGPPLLIGCWGTRSLRLVAEHADIWNIPGPPHNTLDYITQRSRVLDAHCAAVGRDPQTITRSVQYIVSYDDSAGDRKAIRDLIGAGLTHIVLSLRSPLPHTGRTLARRRDHHPPTRGVRRALKTAFVRRRIGARRTLPGPAG
ncbi:LLM class flavin-dependent oxidoreductase [Streptomyces canus]|uniref:LLM class flavin-dependent oxidoreductase n=1 Tax=Streptomyces canus TaxID=58343 RepID=UPI003AF3A22A